MRWSGDGRVRTWNEIVRGVRQATARGISLPSFDEDQGLRAKPRCTTQRKHGGVTEDRENAERCTHYPRNALLRSEDGVLLMHGGDARTQAIGRFHSFTSALRDVDARASLHHEVCRMWQYLVCGMATDGHHQLPKSHIPPAAMSHYMRDARGCRRPSSPAGQPRRRAWFTDGGPLLSPGRPRADLHSASVGRRAARARRGELPSSPTAPSDP
jgi:hypothetical protein